MPQLKLASPSNPELNDLEWAAGFAFTTHGLRIGIRVNSLDQDVLERVMEYLPPGWKPARSPVVDRLYSLHIAGPVSSGIRPPHRLFAGPVKRGQTTDLSALLQMLEWELEFYVAEAARRRVFVHAGVVSWHGRAIVIPGRSFSGKTMLVTALIRAGATYYSDEYAVLDTRGRAHPYVRPLSIREKGKIGATRCPPERLGGHTGTQPLPVSLIALCRYSPGARWRPRLLSPAQAVLAMLPHTLPARRRPAAALVTLQRVATHATAVRGIRGEAEETVDALLRYLAP